MAGGRDDPGVTAVWDSTVNTRGPQEGQGGCNRPPAIIVTAQGGDFTKRTNTSVSFSIRVLGVHPCFL